MIAKISVASHISWVFQADMLAMKHEKNQWNMTENSNFKSMNWIWKSNLWLAAIFTQWGRQVARLGRGLVHPLTWPDLTWPDLVGPGVKLTKHIFLVLLFSCFFRTTKTLVTCKTSCSHLLVENIMFIFVCRNKCYCSWVGVIPIIYENDSKNQTYTLQNQIFLQWRNQHRELW